MRQVRRMFSLLVINIFLMLMVTVFYEYAHLSERFTQLEDNVSVALDMAVHTSTSAEELFSDEFQYKVISYGSSRDLSMVEANILVFGGNGWYVTNPYYLAMFYEDYGRFPMLGELDSLYRGSVSSRKPSGGDGTDAIYSYLYGELGSDYGSSSLSWANKNKQALQEAMSISSSRQPTSNFKEFYDAIGKKVVTETVVKEKASGYSGYTVVRKDVPVLANMGLELSSFNEVGSNYMMDNYCMSYHLGKTYHGNGMVEKSKYYLTPYSLGVTYIPIEVTKPMFIANLDTVVRLQKLASGKLTSVTQMDVVGQEATGCIETSVYDGGTQVSHSHASGDWIVNDGSVEYDLNSVRMKVDYFLVDYYDTSSQGVQEIISRIEGCISAYNFSGNQIYSNTQAFAKTQEKMMTNDTGLNYYSSRGLGDGANGIRIVARVTVRLKVHVCYESPIFQWLCYKYTGGVSEHFDIKLFDPGLQSYTQADDGIWYQYTTYFAQTR